MTTAAEFFGVDQEEVVELSACVHRQLSAKRKTLSEAEQRLKNMMLQAESMKRRLFEFEGMSFGGILSRLKGDREARLKEMRTEFEKHLMDYEAAARSLSGIQAEIASLERECAILARRPMPSNLRPAPTAASGAPRKILCLRPRPV